THGERHGLADPSVAFEVPLLGDHGTIPRAVWLDRTLVHHATRQHPPAVLPDGHPLQETLAALGSSACVPLPRSAASPRGRGARERCGEGCIVGDPALLVPPPGPAAERWAAEREERQQRCLRCADMPMMGVIGIARPTQAPPLTATEVTLLESIALSVAPVVENA
ncbi:MAG: hypothetical protein DMD81_27895, partial [Candidatus Rokuibacteriota bacterium]